MKVRAQDVKEACRKANERLGFERTQCDTVGSIQISGDMNGLAIYSVVSESGEVVILGYGLTKKQAFDLLLEIDSLRTDKREER